MLYRAKITTPFAGGSCRALIPQVFGETVVTITRFATEEPRLPLMGWVAFEGEGYSYPVWMGNPSVSSALSAGSEPPANPQTGDTWYDTDTDTLYYWTGTEWTQITSVPINAGALVGDTLASNVLFSSLKTVGTLNSLAVSGNTSIGGTLTVTGGTTLGNVNITGSLSVAGGIGTVTGDIIYAGTAFRTGSAAVPYNTLFHGTYGLELRNSMPTIAFRHNNSGRSAYIHVNSNLFYILGGATDQPSGSWSQINSQWPLTINLNDNAASFGGTLSAVGAITAGAGATINSGNLDVTGVNGLRFTSYNAGKAWFMSDGTWLRSEINIYNGGNTIANDGFLSIGYGGATDATWRAQIAYNLRVGGNLTAGGYVASTGGAVYAQTAFIWNADGGQDSGLWYESDGNWLARANGVNMFRVNTNGIGMLSGSITMNSTPIYFKAVGDTSHRMYAQDSGSAEPWCDGPVIIGYTGMAFHNASSGVWRWGYRESSTYFWIRNNLLVGSSPNDTAVTATLRVVGTSIVDNLGIFQQSLIARDQIQNNRQGQASYDAASIFINPGSFGASLSFHPGGAAPQFRTATSDANIYVRAADGVTNYPMVGSSFTGISSRETKQDITEWPPKNLSAGTPRVSDRLKAIQPVHFKRLDAAFRELPHGRRHTAFQRLSAYTTRNDLPAYVLPLHVCLPETCGGDQAAPCGWALTHEKGELGFVAEDLKDIFPEVISEPTRMGHMGVNIMSMLTVAVTAIQELSADVQELTDRLERIETNNRRTAP